MPICAVQGCGNGEYKLKLWKLENCPLDPDSKNGTGRCVCDPPFVLYPFPTERNDHDGRKKWIQLVNRKDQGSGKLWKPQRYSRVCSVHFPDHSPTTANPDPILHLGYSLFTQPKHRKPPVLRLPLNRAPATITSSENIIETCHAAVVSDHVYSVAPDMGCENCVKLVNELKMAQHLIEELKEKPVKCALKKDNVKAAFNKFIADDSKVRLNTGLPNKVALDALYLHLLPKLKKMRYWDGCKKVRVISTKVSQRHVKQSPRKSGPQRKLDGKTELVLVLMKLRVGLRNDFLCDVFNISEGTCSQIINTWIRFLAHELKPLIYWPDRITVTKMLPAELAAKYPSLRCTLDCTEIFINRPRHLELQALTWSDYKKHNTVKYLVGIAPNGMISFLSEGWGGRTSDKHIVNESMFLDLVDPGDVILADRGFTINTELLMRQAKLEIPPPSSGWEQQTSAGVSKTKKVANARIHVERAIGRMKWFDILKNTLPITLVPIIDDIVVVCAALCNLLPPLVGR